MRREDLYGFRWRALEKAQSNLNRCLKNQKIDKEQSRKLIDNKNILLNNKSRTELF